ncbi:MAG: hypothetical protein ACYC46_14705 [Acidobacteriaceae bacterium]
MRLARIHESPTYMLIEDTHLIRITEQKVDLRTFAASISKANASFALAIERFHLDQKSSASIGTFREHGDIEPKPRDYDGAVNAI